MRVSLRTPSRRRTATAALAGALALGTVAVPAFAAAPAFAGIVAGPSAGADSTQPLPALDPDLLRQSIAGLPNSTVTGALLSVGGPAGAWSGRSGVADVRTGAPVPVNARYRIGSVTKVFTSVIVLQLAAEHRIDVNQTVQHYLSGTLPDSYPPVTVGELLNHTSGLPISTVDARDTDPRWFVEHRFQYWTPRQVVDSAFASPMAFAPGTEQQYNGVNYFLAGMVIEKVTGDSYADELTERIVRPLGLHDTVSPAPDDVRLTGPHSHGYVNVDGTLADVTEQSPWSWAEGGMISSTADLTRFITALYRGRLLPAAQLAEMFTLPDVPYVDGSNCRIGPDAGRACFSMGLQATTFPDGVTVWGKSGEVPGYTSAVFATRDLSRIAVYDINPTGDRDGTETPYVQNMAAATFDPALFVPAS